MMAFKTSLYSFLSTQSSSSTATIALLRATLLSYSLNYSSYTWYTLNLVYQVRVKKALRR